MKMKDQWNDILYIFFSLGTKLSPNLVGKLFKILKHMFDIFE